MSDSRSRFYWLEWLVLLAAVYLFSYTATLDFDPHQLQQTGEQNESATLPILAELGLRRHGEIPRWNPYMLTGFPHTGDPVSHFWNPVATLPVLLWGGINGMKVSLFLSLLVAAFGQWYLAHVFGLRGIFRLWVGLLFALSGGLAMLSWLGWYELLVGVAWFPWCFALLWRALARGGRATMVLAAVAIAMVITTGGGYYPVYLGVCLSVLTGMALVWHRPRGPVLRRAVAVAALAAGLSAVYWLPLVDGLRYTARDAPPDPMQVGSQPIPYALFNYIVADPAWFRAEVLNKGSSSGWLYIGLLPIAALGLLPWVYGRFRGRRRVLLTLLALLLALLLWNANRHPPVRYLYDLLPFLYTFRFPGRLLIIATSPLLVLAGMGLQALLVRVRRRLPAAPESDGITPRWLAGAVAALLLLLSAGNAFRANQPFMTAPHPRNQNARAALTWLRDADPGLYYINIGGPIIYWDWMAYAYELELPVLNFRYNRRVRSMDAQYGPDSPFNAQPKYTFVVASEPPPPGATQVNLFEEVALWRRDDVLPYAFAARSDVAIAAGTVRAVDVRLDGPNRIVVEATAAPEESRLVVLVSDYPGWQLTVNGTPAEVQAVNGYLGTALRPGAHTYVFAFRPPLHAISLAVSGLAVLAGVLLLAWPRRDGRV